MISPFNGCSGFSIHFICLVNGDDREKNGADDLHYDGTVGRCQVAHHQILDGVCAARSGKNDHVYRHACYPQRRVG